MDSHAPKSDECPKGTLGKNERHLAERLTPSLSKRDEQRIKEDLVIIGKEVCEK